MAAKEFTGKIKYLGDQSISLSFKAATVSIVPENGRVYLESRLVCNPARIFMSNEISNTEVDIKGPRLIVRSKCKQNFWEMHFVGNQKGVNDSLVAEIQSALKAKSMAPQNKAEVGFKKTTSSVGSGQRLSSVSPKINQESPQQGCVPSLVGQETLVYSWNKVTSTPTFSAPINSTQLSRVTNVVAGSSCFTRVKENKRPSGEIKRSSEDESKENQHRGPVSQIMDNQNKQGDRKPLQLSSFRFYGTPAQGMSTTDKAGSNNGFFKVTKSRPVTGPFFTPEGKKGQFSDLMKTYSWNQNRKTTLTAAVRKETPQLQGFANIGNTCYMNSILQSLFGLDTFSMDLHSLCRLHSKALTRQSLAVALTRLMLTKQRPQHNTAQRVEELLHGVKRAISSTAKRFIGNQQHDAHEFLCQVLDQLKEEVARLSRPREETAPENKGTHIPAGSPDFANNPGIGAFGNSLPVSSLSIEMPVDKTPPRVDQVSPVDWFTSGSSKAGTPDQCVPSRSTGKSSPVSQLISPTITNFEFEVVHSFQCINCQERIQKAEQFNDLSVDVPKGNNMLPGAMLSLQDALDIFFQKEEIEYKCEKCGHKKAEVTHKFGRLPRVLILHLKRYTFSQWNNKVQENLQLPRFITLQDHCDTSTVPHLSYRIMQPGSPVKSLVLNSPLRQFPTTTPDSRQRRRKIPQDENGAFRGPKKVRRSLLSEVQGEDPPDKKPMTALQQDSTTDGKDSKKSDSEVITIDMEGEDADLQRAINLSLEEYEANQKYSADHAHNGKETSGGHASNNSPTWSPDSAASNEGAEDEKMDVLNLSYEKQIQLAIHRSLASAENVPEMSEDMADQTDYLNCPPQASGSSTFKKPVLKKANPRKDSQTMTENSRNSDGVCTDFANGDLDCGLYSVRSFTSVSDFMQSSDLRQTSSDSGETGDLRQRSLDNGETGDLRQIHLDSGDCENGDLKQTSSGSKKNESGLFTSCRQPCDTDKVSVPETAKTTSLPVSANIGTFGALSKMSTSGGKSEEDPDTDDVTGQDLESKRRRRDSERGMCTTQNSPERKEDGGALSFEEKLFIAEGFEVEETDAFDHYNFDQGGKEGTEEKENMSPRTRGGRNQEVDSTEMPIDKEAEAKQLQHKLRQTEIEKGILPLSYRLVSIVNHHGETSSYGHYVSDVFDIKKQAWFSFDDKNVEKTTESFVRTRRTSTGYIFFYLSKDIFDDIESSRPGGSGKELIERL